MNDSTNKIGQLNSRYLLSNILIFLFGVFLLALDYNLFILPNNFNMGGTSGLAVIFNHLYNIPSYLFIFVASLLLLILSYFFLSKEQTLKSIVGAFLYPFLVEYTEPLARFLMPYFQFSNILITILVAGFLYGIANGLIYKTGFTTGGGDIIMKLVSKYFQFSEGSAQLITNIFVVLLSGIAFGMPLVIYSAILIFIASSIVDKILIGISDSKMFFIYSKKYNEIKKYVIDDLHTGVTVFDSEGGFLKKSRKILMIVVPTNRYYFFKNFIQEIDKDAFFVIGDCYEVSGGYKKNTLPMFDTDI